LISSLYVAKNHDQQLLTECIAQEQKADLILPISLLGAVKSHGQCSVRSGDLRISLIKRST